RHGVCITSGYGANSATTVATGRCRIDGEGLRATWEGRMLTERTFDTGEVGINYVESSATGPLLIMLHGMTATWQVFETTIPFLAVRWRVVAADLRGHGRSGRVAERYTLMDYVRDIGALHRHLR